MNLVFILQIFVFNMLLRNFYIFSFIVFSHIVSLYTSELPTDVVNFLKSHSSTKTSYSSAIKNDTFLSQFEKEGK